MTEIILAVSSFCQVSILI